MAYKFTIDQILNKKTSLRNNSESLRINSDLRQLAFDAVSELDTEGTGVQRADIIKNVIKQIDTSARPKDKEKLEKEIEQVPIYAVGTIFVRKEHGKYSINPDIALIEHVFKAVRTLENSPIDQGTIIKQLDSSLINDNTPDDVELIIRALKNQKIFNDDLTINTTITTKTPDTIYTDANGKTDISAANTILKALELIKARANLNNPTFEAVRELQPASKDEIYGKVKEIIETTSELPGVYKNDISNDPERLREEVDLSISVLKEIKVIEENNNQYSTTIKTLTDPRLVEAKRKLGADEDLDTKNGSGGTGSAVDDIVAENRIFYGVPGSGKSYKIQSYIGKKYGKTSAEEIAENYKALMENDQILRVVFHPEYAYSDFVGQILPSVKPSTVAPGTNDVTYSFKPGPFTKIIANALNNTEKNYFLIIEEITRGDAAAIFGDIFQLLDRFDRYSDVPNGRKVGESEYSITNEDILREVIRVKIAGDKKIDKDDVPESNINAYIEKHITDKTIRIPHNLWLIATMNTSDQSVFVLDTAFQRRWEMEMIPNEFEDKKLNFEIKDTGITWKDFAKAVNIFIDDNNDSVMANEDKRLGAWFVRPDIDKDTISRERFANKILKYLWDDVFKYNRDAFFKRDEYKTLEKVINKFVYDDAKLSGIIGTNQKEIEDLWKNEKPPKQKTSHNP